MGTNLDGPITNCYATGSVSGREYVGGLVGHQSEYGTITNCYATGSVSGRGNDEFFGGLVGGNGGTVTNCYATASVEGEDSVGGLVGSNSYYLYAGTITNCYSMGSVSGTTHVGGLVGADDPWGLGEVTFSLWDIQTSGQLIRAGGTGKTTAEMQMESTFTDAGWDFVCEGVNGTEDIWRILEGQEYPRMWWEFFAFSPHPHNGAVNVNQRLILSWVGGASAMHHDIYFGEDEEAVANATTESTGIYRGRQVADVTTYDPGILEWGETYYWRIDEVNETDPNNPWKGNLWNFSKPEYLVVDDFEDYNDWPPDEIWGTWIDGYGIPENGSCVGYPNPDFMAGSHYVETVIVHGGNQSMPYFYDNSVPANYSEATANIGNLVIGRDWTKYGATVLSVWFHGHASNAAEPMYVAISNYNGPTAVVDNPDAALIETWREWTIDLQEFAAQGVNLANVDTISIGFGDKNNLQAGGSGVVFFDDIRLYGPPELEPAQ